MKLPFGKTPIHYISFDTPIGKDYYWKKKRALHHDINWYPNTFSWSNQTKNSGDSFPESAASTSAGEIPGTEEEEEDDAEELGETEVEEDDPVVEEEDWGSNQLMV